MLKRTCGIFCSDTAQYLKFYCHINNFSYFTLINVWWREFDFSSYLFKFVSPQYIRSIMTIRLCVFVFFRIISIFFAKFYIYFFAKFSHNFFAKFSHYFFRISISRKFRIFLRNRSKRNFAKKAKIFAFFTSEQNAKTKPNGCKKKCFPFRWKP